MPAIGGAQNLGMARGSISIDTSSLSAVTGVVRSVSQQVTQTLGIIDASAKRATLSFAEMSRGIGTLRGELIALGLGAGLLVRTGLDGARNLRNYIIAFKQFTGNAAASEALVERLIESANKFGLEWTNTLALGRALLPMLKGNTAELDKWVIRAARLRSVFPQAVEGSETIAMNEFLAGQTMSLQRRFNVSGDIIEEAKNQFKDLGEQMEYILNRMGATEESALQMANAFVGVRNELQLIVSIGFTPLLERLQPVLTGFREFLTEVRKVHPGMAEAGAGFVTFVALGAPALLLFNQLVEAGQKLKALGILGGLGRAGGIGLAVAGGVGLGIGATNAIGRATGNEQMANAGLDDLFLTIRKLIVNIGFTFSEVDRIIRVGLVSALRTLVNAVIGAATSLGGVVSAIGAMLPGRMGGNALSKIGGDLSAGGAGLLASSNALFDAMIASMNKRSRDAMRGFMNFMVPPTSAGAADSGGGGGIAGGGGGPDMTERNKVVSQWAKDVARIERDAAKARLDATRDYERSVAQTVAQYNQSALREAEDFARQRARQEANFQRQLADLQADAAKREAAWQRDLTERLADVREESAERLADLDADYAKNRERAERDHRDRLLDAAARLDAVAVRNEQQAFARQQQDAAENYSEQRQEIQAALDERIADELESHQERLEEARAADAERLADMQRSFEEQKALEDEERALRLSRQAEDHQQQLAQMAIAQAERMQQIAEQAASEKAAIDTAFVEQLNGLGIYNQAWRNQQAKAQEESLKSFALFWRAFNAQFPNATQGPQGPLPANLGQFPTSFADFGFASTGSATARATAGGSSRNITISENAIAVYAAPGMDERTLARQVRVEMERLLMEATQ